MQLFDNIKLLAARRKKEPHRDTIAYPINRSFGGGYQQKVRRKMMPANLRSFSRTTFARRAINSIKNPITNLEWEIVPKHGVKESSELKKQIAVATTCFNHPNYDDSFTTLLEQTIEDWCVFGAGVIEQQHGSDPVRPLWMWPVDAQSIQIYLGWQGGSNEARYLQSQGYGLSAPLIGIELRNDEIIYIKANPASDVPWGTGPLETAYLCINRLLTTQDYAGNLASNAQPQMVLHVGDLNTQALEAFREYWINEIEGQGKMPILGSTVPPKEIKLHAGTDDALYLKYQQFLIREIATAFGISPQNLSLEADVNRSTAEVSQDRDWDQAIIPLAKTISQYLTREALHMKLGYYQLEFKFIGLDREDEVATSQIYETYYKNNLFTPNEQREKLGEPPLDNPWADMLNVETQIAIEAARGAQLVEDKKLPVQTPGPTATPAPKPATKSKTLSEKTDNGN